MDFRTELAKTYDRIAAEYSDANFEHFWVKEFDVFKRLVPGNKVLDIGCGVAREALLFTTNNFEYTGVDISEGMLKVARKLAPEGTFKQMDFYALDFPDESFDGFWASASFLHVPKAEMLAVLKEVRRVTKPSGIGFIALKKGGGEGFVKDERYGGMSRYFSFFDLGEYKKMLAAEFEIIEAYEYEEKDERNTIWLCYFVRKSS